MKTAGDLQKAITTIQEDRPHLLLIDLQTPNLDIDLLGQEIKDMSDSLTPLTVAYAQHVQVELLEKAKSAGFDQVLTRGQMNSQIGRIIADSA